MLDLAPLAIALAQKDGRRGVAVGDSRDIHDELETQALAPCKNKITCLQIEPKIDQTRGNAQLPR